MLLDTLPTGHHNPVTNAAVNYGVNLMADHKVEKLSNDPIQHLDVSDYSALSRHTDLSGCFTVTTGVELCYTVTGSTVRVCLKVLGAEISCVTIDNSCEKLEVNLLFIKGSIEVCTANNCLTYTAEVCTSNGVSPWDCSRYSGTIICW